VPGTKAGEVRSQLVRQILIEQHSHGTRCPDRDWANETSRRIALSGKSG
jgi:hypothetical protein